MEKKYFELLKDPRWQKKRLKILERDEFQCQECCDTSRTLHVHHKYYIYDKDPWDYSDDLLITLCNDCHKEEEEYRYIYSDFTKVLLANGYSLKQLDMLLKYILKLPIGLCGLYELHQLVENIEKNV